MEMSLKDQIKAVNMACRDAGRDLVKAKQNGNADWIQDAEFVVAGLEATRTTLNALLNLKSVLGQI
jgi:hypothetical protein